MILQLVFALFFLFGLGVAALLTLPVGVGFLLAGVWLVFGILSFIFLYLVYALCYRRTGDAAYEDAKTPTLVFGILSLIFAGVIPGILYIIAYVKLDDAVKEQQQATPAPGYVAGVPPGSPTSSAPLTEGGSKGSPAASPSSVSAFCSSCGRALAPDQRFCPGCGRPRL